MIKSNRKISIKQNCISRRFEALGTINDIEVFDSLEDSLIDSAVNRVVEIDDLMSAYKPNSDISRLNHNAGRKRTALHFETVKLLCMAKAFSALSDGAFDITARPLIELWGIGKTPNFIPARLEIDRAVKLVNYRDIVTDEKSSTAFLKNLCQAVDLGGLHGRIFGNTFGFR